MAAAQEYSLEQLNYLRICKVTTGEIVDGLRVVFKQLWDAGYKSIHGEWVNSAKNGSDLYSLESPKSRKKNSRELAILRNGNTNEWDCTNLFFAILYSDSIGRGLDPLVKKGVNDLRQFRNKAFAHVTDGKLSYLNFQNSIQTVIVAFSTLKLDITDIEAIKNQISFPTEELRVTQEQLEKEKMRNEEPRSFCVLSPKPSHEVIDRSGEVTKILEEMKRLRSAKTNEITVVYLSGNPGCGKSEIGRQIGEKVFDDVPDSPTDQVKFVFALNASSTDTLIQSYLEFAISLNCDENSTISIGTSKDLSQEDKLIHLKSLVAPKLRKYFSWLLIVDNVTDVKSVFRFLPRAGEKTDGNGQILVTTQDSRSIGSNHSYSYHLSLSLGMNQDEAIITLSQISGIVSDKECTLRVAKALDFQPLALACAATFMKRVSYTKTSISWEEYLQKLQQGKREATEGEYKNISVTYSQTMTAAVKLALEKEMAEDMVMMHAFQFMSAMAPKRIPLEYVVQYVTRCLPDQDEDLVASTIFSSSLILSSEDQPKEIGVHQVVHSCLQYIVLHKSKEEYFYFLVKVIHAFSALLNKFDGHNVNHIIATQSVVAHFMHLSKKLNFYTSNPLSTTTLQSSFQKEYKECMSSITTAGNICQTHAKHVAANTFYRIVLMVNEIFNDENHSTLATTLSNLGVSLSDLGKYEEAQKCLERALAIEEMACDENHPILASSIILSNLGTNLRYLGKYEEAQKYLERTLAIQEEMAYDENNPILAITLSSLATNLRYLGKYEEAQKYLEQALAIEEMAYDENKPTLATALSNLGTNLRYLDQELETVPPEILARGPQAKRAHKQALKSGKVKNPRLPVVLVGQSRSGKTSLLRSLNGEKFNSSEDCTVGAKLQCSLSKVDGDWEKNENKENLLYNHCTAMEVVKRLFTKPAQPIPDKEYDSNSLENIQKEYSTQLQYDRSQNIAAPRLVEQKHLQLQEDPVMKDNNTTQNVDNVENLDHFDKQERLPDDVLKYTETILQNRDAGKQMENYLFFHTMDFAGQPVYSVTHPVFLPPKGIYLLVHSLKNDLHDQATPTVKTGAVESKIDHDPMTNIEHLKFWMSLIDANSTQEGASPVFVVSTHADKPFEAEVKTTAREILKTLSEKGFAPGRHVVDGIYTVNNTVSGSSSPEDAGIKELKTQISKKAKSLPQMNEDIPIRWLLFEKKLKHLVRDDRRKHISFQEAESIALQCEVDISSDELKTLLNYLHDLKVIIHFPEMDGMIIIDTQWLLDMFAKVITVQPIEHRGKYKVEWEKLEDEGIIDVKFLEHLWKDLLNDDTSVESLITIMEKFSLVCKQRDGSYLVPAMLSNSTIDDWHKLVKSDDCGSPLVVRFKSSHLPLGLFPRLLVAVDEMCNLKWKSSTPADLSRNFARFYIQSDDDYEFSLFFMAGTATIAVALIDVNPVRRDDVYDQQCKSILEFLRETLKAMVKSFPWMKSLTEFDFCIRCPICLTSCKDHNKNNCCQDSCVHLVSEEELLKTTKPRCQKDRTVTRNVIPDTSYSHWFPRTKRQSKEWNKDVTNTPKALCSSSGNVEPKDNQCTDIMPLLNLMPPSITMDEAPEKAKEIAVIFNLDKNSVEDPPDDIQVRCRNFCKEMVARGQSNCVQALRNELPSGMTGPLQFTHDLLVKDMDLKMKENLSKALTGEETEWKTFAQEKVGLSADEIKFLDKRKSNPVLEILNDHCGDWSVDELYTAIVDCGANASADRYL